jgi:rhodanese-related sulfurtransferase
VSAVVPEIDIDELARVRDSGVVLVDVREPDEFESFHVPGARLIPLADVPERIEEIPERERVYVICLTGARSAKAVEFLNRQGYDSVNVVGGSKAWLEAGHPVEHGSA